MIHLVDLPSFSSLKALTHSGVTETLQEDAVSMRDRIWNGPRVLRQRGGKVGGRGGGLISSGVGQ